MPSTNFSDGSENVLGAADDTAKFWRDAFEALVATLAGEYGMMHVASLVTSVENRARRGFPLPTDAVAGFAMTLARGLSAELVEIEFLRRTGQRPGAPEFRSVCKFCLMLSTDRPRSKYCESQRAAQMPDGKNPHDWALCDSKDGLAAMALRALRDVEVKDV